MVATVEGLLVGANTTYRQEIMGKEGARRRERIAAATAFGELPEFPGNDSSHITQQPGWKMQQSSVVLRWQRLHPLIYYLSAPTLRQHCAKPPTNTPSDLLLALLLAQCANTTLRPTVGIPLWSQVRQHRTNDVN